MTRFFASPSFPLSSSFYIRHLAIVLHKHSRASCLPTYVKKGDFPMGPQVKTGTHSVRWGTPSVPVAWGESCHPSFSLHPSIPPSVHPLPAAPSCWSTVLNHPGMCSLFPFPPFSSSPPHSPPVPSLIHSLLSLHFPPTFPPTLHAFQLTPPICHPSLCS